MRIPSQAVTFALVFFFSCSQVAQAQLESLHSELESATQAAQRNSGVPGIVVGLFDKESLALASAGVRRAGGTEAMEVNDTVFLGSTFKAITASLVARYVDRGELSWNTTLSEIFTETEIHEGYRDVTVRQVLAHRAGFGNDFELFADDPFEGTPSEERAYFIPLLLSDPPPIAVESFSYSNLGYTAAGAILERISGKTFDAIVEEELVDTLGLTSLMFGPPAGIAGHNEFGEPVSLEEQELPAAIGPAGLYSMNLADWAKIARQHCVDSDFVSAESLSILQSPVGGPNDGQGSISSYALGWEVVPIGDQVMLTHNGSNGYWLSSVLMNPETCRGVFVSSNQDIAGEVAFESIVSNPAILEWVTSVPEPRSSVMVFLSLGLFLVQRNHRNEVG